MEKTEDCQKPEFVLKKFTTPTINLTLEEKSLFEILDKANTRFSSKAKATNKDSISLFNTDLSYCVAGGWVRDKVTSKALKPDY